MSDQKPSVEDQQVIGAENVVANQTQSEKEAAQAAKAYSQQSAKGQLSMEVRIHSPFRNYYDGMAYSLSVENATGPFDILPKHHNFISLLLPCQLIIRTVTEGEKRIQISGGIIHVKADQVIVFLDI